jgi:two-component system KDP operon response regulator KdpE
MIEIDKEEKILIVDDDPSVSKIFRIVLSMRGYSVHLVRNDTEAFAQISEWHPDLVITDLMMPAVHGIEFCKRLRMISDVPIIVLSAEQQLLIKVEALDAGANDYVVKPFSMPEVQARIRALLRHNTNHIVKS